MNIPVGSFVVFALVPETQIWKKVRTVPGTDWSWDDAVAYAQAHARRTGRRVSIAFLDPYRISGAITVNKDGLAD